MPKYTRKIIKKGGSGLTSSKSMRNLNSPKTTGKRPRSPSQRSPSQRSPSPPKSNKKQFKLTLKPPDEKIMEDLNYEKKDKEERDEHMKDKNKSITEKMRKQISLGKYLSVEHKDKGHKVDQTKSAAQEVGDEWNAQRKYGKASDIGATFSPFKSPTKNKNSSTIFGFPNFKSPIQGSPLPILSPQSSSTKPRTSTILNSQAPLDLFPMSPGKGGKKHRKKTYKSYKMKKTNRNKNRKSRRNSKRNSKKNKK